MARLPEPRLTQTYRLEAALGEPVDVGDVSLGRRRIVPLTGGTFRGLELNGKLLPGASADWQVVLRDGTAFLYVQSRGVRRGSPEVLERLGRGENVDASEYTFRTSTRIEGRSRNTPHLSRTPARRRETHAYERQPAASSSRMLRADACVVSNGPTRESTETG
jgi:Protein of unknown function (DUF3237)